MINHSTFKRPQCVLLVFFIKVQNEIHWPPYSELLKVIRYLKEKAKFLSFVLPISVETISVGLVRDQRYDWGHQIHGYHSKTTYSIKLKFGDFSFLSINQLMKEFNSIAQQQKLL